MEACADIGSLLGRTMTNMPPMRCNQLRRSAAPGPRRGGRRGAPRSMAPTLCRGRSHDDAYFQRPERITGDPPPAPYVDTSRAQILRRVLTEEVLRRAFAALGLFATTSGDSVHGEFGEASGWILPPTNQPTGYAGTTGEAPPARSMRKRFATEKPVNEESRPAPTAATKTTRR